MRHGFVILLLIVTGWVLSRDVRLALSFQHGELVRVVVDQEMNGVITKHHVTQIPSGGDGMALLLWAFIHVGLATFWRRYL
jgi:hypothetical protein